MTDLPADDSPIQAKSAVPPPGRILHDADKSDELGAPSKPKSGKLQSRVAVLSFLFLVTGAIGVPLLWVNPNFSRSERIFWSIVVSLYTLSLLAIFGSILWWFYRWLIDLGTM